MQMLMDQTTLEEALSAFVSQEPRFQDLRPWLKKIRPHSISSETIIFSWTLPDLAPLFHDSLRHLLIEAVHHTVGSTPLVAFQSPPLPAVSSLPTPTTDNPAMTFDLFCSGAGNRLALAAARAVTETPGTKYNPLFIHAGIGLGKTHLLQAIAHEIRRVHPSLALLSISGQDFHNTFETAKINNTLTALRSAFASLDVLILDDIQSLAEANREETQIELFELFTSLYHRQKQLVFSSVASPLSINGLSNRLVSRLQWGLVVEIDQPLAPTRMELLKRKSGALGLELSPDVFSFLAENLCGNIREMEGVLKKLHSHMLLLNQPIDLTLVRQILRDYTLPSTKNVTMKQVAEFVTRQFHVSHAEMLSQSRVRSIAFPRQIAMYLAHMLTPFSLEEIGKYFGGRDHSTVKHGCEKIKALSEKDASIRTLIHDFMKSL